MEALNEHGEVNMEIYNMQLHACTIYILEKTLRPKGNILLEEGMPNIGNPPNNTKNVQKY